MVILIELYLFLNFVCSHHQNRVRPLSQKQQLYEDRKDQSSLNFPDAGQIQVQSMRFITCSINFNQIQPKLLFNI